MDTTYFLTATYNYANTASGAGNEDALAAMILALFSGVYFLVVLVVSVLCIIGYCKIFSKAGEPWWGGIVPFYNMYLLFKIAWGNGWLFLLMLIPVVGAFVGLVAYFKLCLAFGHGVGFFLGLLFLTPIFLMILGFDSSEYQGPA